MSRLWRAGQPITVHFDRAGLPVAFAWQGITHRVQCMLQHWEIDDDWWRAEGGVQREYFAVITTSGILCVLYFDLMDQQWHMTRVYD